MKAAHPVLMAQQPASVSVTFTAVKGTTDLAADVNNKNLPGILKTPTSCLTSADGDVAVGPPTTLGLNHNPSVDTFFLKIDSCDGKHSDNEARNTDINSSGAGSQRQQKRALFVDPLCQSSDPGASTRSSKTPSLYGPETVRYARGAGIQTSRTCRPAEPVAHAVLPLSARTSSKKPLLQQHDTGGSNSSRTCPGSVLPDHGKSSRGNLGNHCSLLLPETPAGWLSCSSTPHCKSSSSSNSCSGGSPRLQSSSRRAAVGTGSSSGSGCGSAASGRQYGTAWYLKTTDWDHVTHKIQPGSTWHRESVYLEELDEQHRFAQQLSDPTSSSGSGDCRNNSSTPPVAALAAAVQGSGKANEALAALSPAVLASNTWAMSKKGILDVAAADAAAAASTVQYYKQLQEVARQQAAMNEKVKGTFALRAYKEFMRAKGYRQAAALQRLPTPTDEDMRLVTVRAQQQLKRQQQHQRLHWHHQGHQQQQQQTHQLQQHQPRGTEGMRASAVGVVAAAMVVPVAAAAVAVGCALTADSASGEPGTATAAASSTNKAAAQTTTIPKLNLSGINQVTKQLHELKSSCHPDSGLDGSDWQMLEVLLTSGRQAMLTARAAATAAGSSCCDSYSLPGSSSSSSRTGTPGGPRPPWQSCCNGSSSSSSRLQMRSRDATDAVASSGLLAGGVGGMSLDGYSSNPDTERATYSAAGARTGTSSARCRGSTPAAVAAHSGGEVTLPPAAAAAHDACIVRMESQSVQMQQNFDDRTSCSTPGGDSSNSSGEGESSVGSETAHCSFGGSQPSEHQQQRLCVGVHWQQQHQHQQQDHFANAAVEGSHPAGEPAAAAAEPAAPAARDDAGSCRLNGHGFICTTTHDRTSSAAEAVQASAIMPCDTVAMKAIAITCSPQQQQSPRQASRGGTGRLSPYGNALLEEIPLRIDYTLTRGASGHVGGRASPTRLSTTGNTPRSARGAGLAVHHYFSSCS